MTNASWSLQSTKRKRTTPASTARKRVRIFDDVDTRKQSNQRSKDQKTLTQIQWIKNPSASSQDAIDLNEIDSNGSTSTTPAGVRRGLGKGNSTLTQMDWLNDAVDEDFEVTESAKALSPEPPSRSTTLSRMTRPRGSSAKRKRNKSNSLQDRETVKVESIESDVKDYTPSTEVAATSRPLRHDRNSRRKLERLDTRMPTESSDDRMPRLEKASPRKSDVSSNGTKKSAISPVIEIGDSDESEDEKPRQSIQRAPQTPPPYEIASSQTPETVLRPTTNLRQGTQNSGPRRSSRKPLAEKSGNILSKPSTMQDWSKPAPNPDNFSPRRRKICILKLPKQATKGHLARGTDVRCEKQDIVETHPICKTSISPNQTKHSSEDEMPSSPPTLVTIPTLPISETLSNSQSRGNALRAIDIADTGTGSEQIITDLNEIDRLDDTTSNVDDIMLLEQDAINENNDSDGDDHAAFGSPVANDTQFNVALNERTSSPNPGSYKKARTRKSPQATLERSVSDGRTENARSRRPNTPIPVPTLVQDRTPVVGQHRSVKILDKDEAFNLSSSTPVLDGRELCAETSVDNTTQISSCSSPQLPPSDTPTQRIIKPASMPHPSQVSTQAPTQHYPLSLLPDATQESIEAEDSIMIKDSDSVRLSQIPVHTSQKQNLGSQLPGQLDDDLDDLDLDPSTPQLERSARIPLGLAHQETNSSLRSIPPLLDNSKDSSRASQLLSSPTLPKSVRTAAGAVYAQAGPRTRAKTRAEGENEAWLDVQPPQPSREPDIKKHSSGIDSDSTTLIVTSPISSLPPSSPLSTWKDDPIPGFDNDTQSNFTRDGRITAAYIHRQRKTGAWPDWFVPAPFQITDPEMGGTTRRRRQ